MKNSSLPETKAPSTKSGGWRAWVAWFILILFTAEILSALFMKRADQTFAVSEFARLPLVFNGRVQPMDSLARNSLIQIRGITEVPLEGNGADGAWGRWEDLRGKGGELSERHWYQFSKHPKKLKPADWLLEVMANPKQADDRYIFVINHPDLRGLLKLEGGVEKSGLHFYRFNDIRDRLEDLRGEVGRAGELDASLRSPFDRAVLQLNNAFSLYFRLKNTLQPENTANFSRELDEYLAAADKARAEVQERRGKGENLDDAALESILAPVHKFAGRYDAMSRMENPLIVPPEVAKASKDDWRRMGDALLRAPSEGLPQSVRLLAGIATAYQAGEVGPFNQVIGEYRSLLAKQGLGADLIKGGRETFFNRLLAFKRSMYVYIMVFLLVLLYWANLNNLWRVTAVRLLCVGFVVHTAGLLCRMWLEGRPPVTNLYSSAIFIGWGAVVLGLVLERVFKDGIGTAVASCVGFLSLIIAHNLSLGGDTMEMMRAVLDTNFWLATHVVVITLGYASTFVAGFLALIYILRGVFTTTLGEATARSLARMVYAIVCFATLFSFVGTVLGGIWADQSWGRFWGWDPKENGALIIVLWNVLILHARWGGLIRERGLINCAIVGNIVTSWSWFGVNMLGIGLHSYGFMDAAFKWLMLFVGSQLLLIGLGLLPLNYWRSFRKATSAGQPPPGGGSKAVPVGT
jgi:ABC-type transport system involved in cytochrome c biogenesis permease subunit